MGNSPTRDRSTPAVDPLPGNSQEVTTTDRAPNWRDRALADREARIRATHHRQHEQRASYLRAELRSILRPLLAFLLGLAVLAAVFRATVLSQQRWPLIVLIIGAAALAALVDARTARARTSQHLPTIRQRELNAAPVLGDLDAFESAASATATVGVDVAVGARSFVLAARGQLDEAKALLAVAPDRFPSPTDELWRAIAALVVAMFDDDHQEAQRCARIAEQRSIDAPVHLRRLIDVLTQRRAAPFRSAQPTTTAAVDDFGEWLETFVPSVAQKLGMRRTTVQRAWFRAPGSARTEQLARREPWGVRLLSGDAFAWYGLAAVFGARAIVPIEWSLGHDKRAVLAMAGAAALVGLVYVALQRFARRAIRTIASTAVHTPVTKEHTAATVLATHTSPASQRLFAMTRLACRHLLSGHHDAALALARRIAVESRSDDPDVSFYRGVVLWIAGLTGEEAHTEALLAAVERSSPGAPARVARRFDARLALAIAHNDGPLAEHIAQDAPIAAPSNSVASWVSSKLSPSEFETASTEALEGWLSTLGLLEVIAQRCPSVVWGEKGTDTAPIAPRELH